MNEDTENKQAPLARLLSVRDGIKVQADEAPSSNCTVNDSKSRSRMKCHPAS